MAMDGGDNEAVGTGNDARVALLEQINDANDQLRADEFLSVNDDGSTEAFTVKSPDGTETPLADEAVVDKEAESAIEALAEETHTPEPEPKRFKIRVNEQDLYLTEEELIARAQKVEAADRYLAEAARLRGEAVARQIPQEDSAKAVDDDLAIARAIQMGTEEEAVAALRKLRERGPSVSADDISRTVDERLTFNAAIQSFRTEFSDIVSDPVLHQLALDTDAKLLAAGDRRPYAERYADIGRTLRGKVAEWTKQRTPAPQGEEKLQRKAAAPAVPKAASQKTESTVAEEKEETVGDIIAGIAKSRGGPQWMQNRH